MSHHIVISDRVQAMSESETLKMAQMARELKAQGHDVISLSIGEPDFDTPDHVKEAAMDALRAGHTKYTPVSGTLDLRQAISDKFKRDNNLDYAVNQIVVSNGAKQSIYNICMALLNPGDECIVFAPFWVSYAEIIKMMGATPIYVSADIDSDYKVTAAQVEAAITERTKMVLFSSPCNPTGSVFLHDELAEIADVLSKHKHIMIVSDEIYEYINFTGEHVSIGSFPSVKDQTITVNGMAKGFAMTGWRLGYMGAPKDIAAACDKIQGQVTSGATAFGQAAAAFALRADMEPTRVMAEEFRRRRDMVIALLDDIPGFRVNHPLGAFYMFPDISFYFGKSDGKTIIKDSDDFADYLMTQCYVGVVSGSAFGAPKCFRLSYAASDEQLKEAIRRIKEVCARLK